ncbi:filamentation protein-like protein [Venturia nashicola]|uniref:Filamentation protein-like protein n=1 Tax=Venturia nashicola TaxID=86259 RepID=A0A4Z1NKL5_9PEZI|nr:filamentation protein-like protein [Venturia nashicola]TLD23648.1 filamentation protein-like protein [Venturia nashicola]
MAAHETEKALRYIDYLDNARCNAEWDKIPELTRKLAKHAPHRKCLILTAQTEAQVAVHDTSHRPPTAAGEAAPSSLSRLITPLLSAIEEELVHKEDTFQATVCLGWIHWVLLEPSLAIARLPRNLVVAMDNLVEHNHDSSASWVQVCYMKAAFIKGFAQEKSGASADALRTYKSTMPFLTAIPSSLGSGSPEFRVWTERALSRMVAVTIKPKPLGEIMDFEGMLRMFHLWLSLFRYTPVEPMSETARRVPSTVDLGTEVDYSRWDVWVAYYETLSEILRLGYCYSPTYTEKKPQILFTREPLSDEEYLRVRLRQRAELKKVESSIEAKLLEETRFPKANERNSRVERWVDAVIQNWRIMCGPSWQDEELGEGGKNAIARGILDMLYRAATKSYHSTQILRYLFCVHAYVAEFDLAFKAFDSYVELVQRGKQREEKSGEPDYSLDNDDNVLQTASEAVRILCRFGARKEVEKAQKISSELLQWVEKAASEAEAQELGEVDKGIPIRAPVSLRVISEAYRALGTCEATWARWTYDASTRNTHQQKAVEYYRNALDIRYANGNDLETQFALAFVLAEMRELAPAINIAKQALSRPSETQTFSTYLANGNGAEHFQRDGSSDFTRARKLIPFWHLLTLLLSAKADMSTAARSSNAAFEQFEDPTNLFGPEQTFKSEHLNDLEKPETPRSKALIDMMERHEKEGIVQVKITQIAILEELQSSADAVDASAELLALFARMFGDPKGDLLRSQARAATAKPPKSAVGSIRHSLINRARSRSRKDKPVSSIPPPLPSTRATSNTTAPTIQITSDDGSTTRGRRGQSNGYNNVHHHSRRRSKSQNVGNETPQRTPSHKLQKRSASQSKQNSFESHRSAAPATAEESIVADYANGTPNPVEGRPRASSASRPGTANSDSNAARVDEHPIPSIAGRMSSSTTRRASTNRGTPTKRFGIAPTLSSSVESISPEPVFPVFQERKHRITLLIHVWLFVAGLYTRAEAFDDAKGAIEEAADLVQALESQVAQQDSSVKAFASRGWGGGKSVEELWADIWAQRGALARAQDLQHEAMSNFEKAVAHHPDHPAAVVGLSEILLDIYCQKLSPEPTPPVTSATYASYISSTPSLAPLGSGLISAPLSKATSIGSSPTSIPPTHTPILSRQPITNSITRQDSLPSNTNNNRSSPSDLDTLTLAATATSSTPNSDHTPEELNRLAARDRAYGLLNTLTKLGSGWDYSEAWFLLARAYEESGQVGKAKEVLWWCVELEDTRPVRGWGVINGAC